MARHIKLVIFDLDGTLMDAYKAVYRSINFTLKKFGFPSIDHATIKRTVGWGDKHLLESFAGKEHIAKILTVYRRHHAQALKKDTKLLPGAKALLKYLRKNNYRLAVASNRPTRFSLIALRHLKIKNDFDFVLCGDKAKRPKPYPDILLQILNHCRLKPDQAIYVGDMTIDIQTGKRAKVKTVAVLTGSSKRSELARLRPYRIIDRLNGVPKILKEFEK